MIGRICFVILIILLIAFLNIYVFARYGDDGTEDRATVAIIYCMLNAIVIGGMITGILVSKGLL